MKVLLWCKEYKRYSTKVVDSYFTLQTVTICALHLNRYENVRKDMITLLNLIVITVIQTWHWRPVQMTFGLIATWTLDSSRYHHKCKIQSGSTPALGTYLRETPILKQNWVEGVNTPLFLKLQRIVGLETLLYLNRNGVQCHPLSYHCYLQPEPIPSAPIIAKKIWFFGICMHAPSYHLTFSCDKQMLPSKAFKRDHLLPRIVIMDLKVCHVHCKTNTQCSLLVQWVHLS